MYGKGPYMSYNMEHDILALDFDGVIADSINECLFSGYNAYSRFSRRQPVETFDHLDDEWIDKARHMRRFIRNGEDYVYIAKALDQGVEVDRQEDFDRFLDEYHGLQRGFLQAMKNERLSTLEQNPTQWHKLNHLYPGMQAFLSTYPNKDNLCIITTKLLVFVKAILQTHRIEFKEDRLFDTSDGRSKGDIIEDITYDRGVTAGNFYFVDDQVDTLIKVKSLGIHLYLAAWGYNDAQQHQSAQEHGIPVFQLDDFYRTFKHVQG